MKEFQSSRLRRLQDEMDFWNKIGEEEINQHSLDKLDDRLQTGNSRITDLPDLKDAQQ